MSTACKFFYITLNKNFVLPCLIMSLSFKISGQSRRNIHKCKKKLAFRFLKSHFHVKLNLFERLIQTAFLLTYRFSRSYFLTTSLQFVKLLKTPIFSSWQTNFCFISYNLFRTGSLTKIIFSGFSKFLNYANLNI